MLETAPSALAPWANFFIMIGSSAAALTGLMFVVITLVAGVEGRRKQDGLSTFSTPTVVHFCAALLVSAVLVAPWRVLICPAATLALAGTCGIVYALRILYRTKRLTGYTPDIEDWAWYTLLPLVAYGSILAGAIALLPAPIDALFVLAAGVALLIFLGIRNAWDVVTFLAVGNVKPPESAGAKELQKQGELP